MCLLHEKPKKEGVLLVDEFERVVVSPYGDLEDILSLFQIFHGLHVVQPGDGNRKTNFLRLLNYINKLKGGWLAALVVGVTSFGENPRATSSLQG
jgi:hypothetical protein